MTDISKLPASVLEFFDFLNEPTQYEYMRMVRDYRHEAYGRWEKVMGDILAALSSSSSAERSAVGEGAGIIRGFLDCPEIADCAPEDLDNETRNLERRARQYLSALVLGTREAEQTTCDRCQGNGEIVTDWERYKHPHEGDAGDEAVAECPDCGGEGYASPRSLPAPDERLVSVQQTLREFDCPRPCNHRPDEFSVGECVDAGECGCGARAALAVKEAGE